MQSVRVDGDRLREVREDRELTTTQLAALLSSELGRRVHPSTITRLEMGRRQPSARTFGAICRALRCSKSALLADDKPEKASA